MNTITLATKLAAAIDSTIAVTEHLVSRTRAESATFLSVFKNELQRRRTARSGPTTPVVVTNPKLM